MIGKINVDFYEPYPKNPKIAKVFKEIGLVDELGSGVRNITKYTKIYSGGIPEFKEDDIFRTIVLLNCHEEKKAQDNVENKIIEYCREEKSIFEIMNYLGYKNRNRFTRDYITPMALKGLLYMTIPNKPTSRNQIYISKLK